MVEVGCQKEAMGAGRRKCGTRLKSTETSVDVFAGSGEAAAQRQQSRPPFFAASMEASTGGGVEYTCLTKACPDDLLRVENSKSMTNK